MELTFAANGDQEIVTDFAQNIISVTGTFGSGTVQGSYSPDNGVTYIDDPNLVFSSNQSVVLEFVKGAKLKFTLSGSTSPNLIVFIKPYFAN